MNKWTAHSIKACKGQQKICCLTAHDCTTARLLDEAGMQLILVGDSLAMTVLGYDNTLPVTMEEMLHHTRAVARGCHQALVIADMPFMSYQVSSEQALTNAGRFIKEAGAGGVKIEGGSLRAPCIRTLVDNGIPVLAHIGLTPQSISETGGYKVQGRGAEAAGRLLADAAELERAGAFAIVLECIPSALAMEISGSVSVPTIGIGAGPHCDGQILVSHDLLGIQTGVSPRFVKHYAALGDEMKKAFASYRDEVKAGTFPATEHTYGESRVS